MANWPRWPAPSSGSLDSVNHILVKGITGEDLGEYGFPATGGAGLVVQMLANLQFECEVPREVRPLAIDPGKVTFTNLIDYGLIKPGDRIFHYFHRGPEKGETAYATAGEGGTR